MTVQEYLALEESSDVKHEFVNGEVIAMAGAEPEHNEVKDALVGALRQRLATKPCRTFSSDQRVLIDETRLYAYPDIVVVCGKPSFDGGHPPSLLNPQIVIEVLSPGTEAHDRGAKFAHHQRRPSIEEYVLVSSTEQRVEH